MLSVDIGTTTMTARIGDDRSERRTVRYDGAPFTQSCVCFDGGEAAVGEAATAACAGTPSSFVASPLESILKGELTYGGTARTPAELISPLLALTIDAAGATGDERPDRISCIVPVHTAHLLRAPFAEAAASLELPEPWLVPAPLAAMLHMTGGEELAPGKTAVIIDAGGTSMDVTVIRAQRSGPPTILAHRSDRGMGANRIDGAIIRWLRVALEQTNPALMHAVGAETNRTLLASLHREVRGAKEALARSEETNIAVTTVQGSGSVPFTRGDLERILGRWLDRARSLLADTLAEAHLPADGTIGCALVGGGAGLPSLAAALGTVARITVAEDPLTAAADGALIADDRVLQLIAGMDDTPTPPQARSSSVVGRLSGWGKSVLDAVPPTPFRTGPDNAPSGPNGPGRSPGAPTPVASPASGLPDAGAGPAPRTPMTVPAAFERIRVGSTHVLAEDADGTIWQWGSVTRSPRPTPVPPGPVPGLTGEIATFDAGNGFSVASNVIGRVLAWGANESVQLGVVGARPPGAPPAEPALPEPVTHISCGDSHTLAITAGGQVLSWGTALWGRLGRGGFGALLPQEPGYVAGGLSGIVAVAAGHGHSLALDQEGTLWGWGRDNRQQLRGMSGGPMSAPVKLPFPGRFGAIDAGKGFSIALDWEGSVWTWGRNDHGQLGLGFASPTAAQGKVNLPGPAMVVFAGQSHAGAILDDGGVYLWGANDAGQVGRPDAVGFVVPLPTRIALPDDAARAVEIGGGDSFTVCMDERGRIFTWGSGTLGIDGSGMSQPQFATDRGPRRLVVQPDGPGE